MKVAIITSDEIRHKFFRRMINVFNEIDIVFCITEISNNNQKSVVLNSDNYTQIEKNHFKSRDVVENDFFGCLIENLKEANNNIFIKKGELDTNIDLINNLKRSEPDIIISYGSSIIKEPLINLFKNRFINIHLGLSPYYKGAGTNFWPLVNNEPEFIGVTFMHINNKIDAGEVIHQMRPKIYNFDNVHTIGNRLIRDMVFELEVLLLNFKKIKTQKQIISKKQKIYKKKDFNEGSLMSLNKNFENRMIQNYLNSKNERDKLVPIINMDIS